MSDERLRQMNEVLQGIRLLKLYGWECLYGDRILRTRAKELKLLDKDSFYWAIMSETTVLIITNTLSYAVMHLVCICVILAHWVFYLNISHISKP